MNEENISIPADMVERDGVFPGGYPYLLPSEEEIAEMRKELDDAANMLSRRETKAMHNHAIDSGFWEESMPWMMQYSQKLMLIVSEATEAMEVLRKEVDRDDDALYGVAKDNFGKELADIVIRVFDLAEASDIDLLKVIREKHEYNLKRGYRHGNKNF